MMIINLYQNQALTLLYTGECQVVMCSYYTALGNFIL